MDLHFDPEQTMLRDSLRKYLDREYGFDARRERLAKPDGFCRATWAELADLGVLGAAIPAEDGGLGAGRLGTLIVGEAFGRALVVEPWLATVVLGGGLIELAGDGPHRGLLPEVADGRCLLAFAHVEPDSRHDLAQVATRAAADGTGFRLTGAKTVVLHGAAADRLIVSARVHGAVRDPEGLALFVVDRHAPGLAVRGYPTIDGLQAADVALDDVRVPAEAALGPPGRALPILEHALDRAGAALCAEAVGAMDALLARTVAYLRTRQQFGAPLAKFQALQHRVADVAIQLEQARSMAYLAALRADDPDARARQRFVAAARASVAESARFVGEQAVQLHGGIGMTDALDVSHYFRRLAMASRTFGDADWHVQRFLDATG